MRGGWEVQVGVMPSALLCIHDMQLVGTVGG